MDLSRRQFLKGAAAVGLTVSLPAIAKPAEAAAPVKTITWDQIKFSKQYIVKPEFALNLEQYHERYIQPAIEALARQIDRDAMRAIISGNG